VFLWGIIHQDETLTLLSLTSFARTPTGFITRPATILGTKPAPFMAAFSSQGPNTVTPGILKVLMQ
jgi:hypothetical protein